MAPKKSPGPTNDTPGWAGKGGSNGTNVFRLCSGFMVLSCLVAVWYGSVCVEGEEGGGKERVSNCPGVYRKKEY